MIEEGTHAGEVAGRQANEEVSEFEEVEGAGSGKGWQVNVGKNA